ncbi:MAG TPA: hypothetical protein VI258_01970 [Rhodanobacteraceae bacterium]
MACGIAFALLLTVIELKLFDVAMRREIVRAVQAPPDRVLHVELIAREEPVEIPPEPVPPLPSRTPAEAQRMRARSAPRDAPRRSRAEAATPTRIPRLVGLDGHILLPDGTTENHRDEPRPLAGEVARGDPFARANPLPYRATRFDRYFPDVRETLGGEVIRKTTISGTWRTPWGTVVECKASLILIGIGVCTWGPAPGLTEEEMKAMHADPPLLAQPPPGTSPAPAPAPEPGSP